MHDYRLAAALVAVMILATPAALRAAEPDQVLVLFNADWTGDEPGTEPGQDSLEVARHYARRHTDPVSGAKPLLLGLRCTHGENHLDGERLEEASSDNYYALRYTGDAPDPITPGRSPVYLSRTVQALLPAEADVARLRLEVADRNDRSAAEAIFADGRSVRVNGQPVVVIAPPDPQGRRTLSFDLAIHGLRGDRWVWLTVAGADGGTIATDHLRLVDAAELETSVTGPDGVPDDKHVREDVLDPVRRYLEDPANAVDGQLLKDRILYIVVAPHLPRTVARPLGLGQSAVMDSVRDSGELIDLGQRLEMLFYDIEAVRPLRLMPIPLKRRDALLQPLAACNTWWVPFWNRRDQPWLHEAAYARPLRAETLAGAARFTSETRNQLGPRFVYLSSRLDGPSTRAIKEMIDSACYASAFWTPGLGGAPQGEFDGEAALARAVGLVGVEALSAIGLPGVQPGPNYVVSAGLRGDEGYWPGAIDWHVISGNGFNASRARVHDMLADGVSATGAATRAYNGCAHTTTHGWWDGRVLWHYLLRGWDLGEAWMLSRYKLGWVTTFVGDPLYRPDLRRTRYDRTPPKPESRDAVALDISAPGGQVQAQVRVPVSWTDGPELATLTVEYWPVDEPQRRTTIAGTRFVSAPDVVLPGLAPGERYAWQLTLTDPYGNTFESSREWGEMMFQTPDVQSAPPDFEGRSAQRVWLGGPQRRGPLKADAGRAVFTYEPGSSDSAKIFWSGNVQLTRRENALTLRIGGRTIEGTLPGNAPVTLEVRYRAEPATRELWVHPAGDEPYRIASDNRGAWQEDRWDQWLNLADSPEAGQVSDVRLWSDSPAGAR